MKPKQKLNRIIGITGWSRDHLADLLGIGNLTLLRWMKGRAQPQDAHMVKIDTMYDGIVKPLECEIDRLSDVVEKKILNEQIRSLKDDDCEV